MPRSTGPRPRAWTSGRRRRQCRSSTPPRADASGARRPRRCSAVRRHGFAPGQCVCRAPADIAAAACLLGQPTPRVAGNASRRRGPGERCSAGGRARSRGAGLARDGDVPGRARAQPPALGVGDSGAIPNLTELMLENQRRVQAQLEAIERLRGGSAVPPGAGGQPPQLPPGQAPANPTPLAPQAAVPPLPPRDPGGRPRTPPKSLDELGRTRRPSPASPRSNAVHQQVAIPQGRERSATRLASRSATITRHLVFVGNPGTGKTTVARLVGGLYRAPRPALPRASSSRLDRPFLVAGYLGQTAIKTSEVVAKALGASLSSTRPTGCRATSTAREAINTPSRRWRTTATISPSSSPAIPPDDGVHRSESGLASRFKTIIEFADHTDDETAWASSPHSLGERLRRHPRGRKPSSERSPPIPTAISPSATGRFVRQSVEEGDRPPRLAPSDAADHDRATAPTPRRGLPRHARRR